MIKKLLALFVVLLALAGCQTDEHALFCSAKIVLTSDDVAIERVQATLTAENVNTKQVVATSAFMDKSTDLSLLKGAYQISIEGVILSRNDDGTQTTHNFRVYRDYCEFISDDLSLSLPITIIQ